MSSAFDRPGASCDDLILGAVDDYSFLEMEPFLLSLRQAGYEGHLCLFAGPRIGRGACAKMRRLGVEVIQVGEDFPFVADPHPANVRQLPTPIHVCNYRYYLYYDYLLKRGSHFRHVLVTDVRDVVFQKDPFDFEIAEGIHVAMENPDILIGDCPWTGPWVMAAYGGDMLEHIAGKPMSCSGTTLASVPQMKRYLRAMIEEISNMNSAEAYLDQAAHNFLLHNGKIAPIHRLENFEGPILTVGSESTYRLNDEQLLVNRDGSIIAVIHQYDRHADLARLLAAKIYPSPLRRLAAKLALRVKGHVGSLPSRATRFSKKIRRKGSAQCAA